MKIVMLSSAKHLLAGYALSTLSLVGFEEILGEEWLTTDLFRIGASSAANNLISAIEDKDIKYF